VTTGPPQRVVPDPGGPDEHHRELGSQMVILLSGLMRIARAYSVSNQVFRTHVGKILQAFEAIFEHSNEAVFVSLETDIYLNGVRIPVNSSKFRFHQDVVKVFRQHKISGLRAVRGVTLDDLIQFFGMFLGSEPRLGASFLKACTDVGLTTILPAVHASTDPDASSSDLLYGDAEFDGEDSDGDGGGGGGGGGGPGGEAGDRSSRPSGRGGISVSRGWTRKYYWQAVQGARSLLTTTLLNSGLEMRHAKRVVQPLVDGAFAAEPIVVGLSSLRDHDEFTYSHSVNVCSIAVTMGHLLGMDRRTLADLGVAALLHDVGKSAVADQIFHPLEAFTDEERAAAERHPVEGAKLLARSTTLNSTTLRCMRVALEHHAGPGDECYPSFPGHWQISMLSQIVSIADCFVSLHTRRGELIEIITPYEALGMILGKFSERFEPALLWALVQAIGFYPPGQVVELDDGSLALVLAPNLHDLARPHVRVIRDAEGKILPGDQGEELLPIPFERGVRRALRGSEYPNEEPEQPEQNEAA
jgi:HD-GYP domain-containing protein (c-di-GMP phosphodiesterase class II)